MTKETENKDTPLDSAVKMHRNKMAYHDNLVGSYLDANGIIYYLSNNGDVSVREIEEEYDGDKMVVEMVTNELHGEFEDLMDLECVENILVDSVLKDGGDYGRVTFVVRVKFTDTYEDVVAYGYYDEATGPNVVEVDNGP